MAQVVVDASAALKWVLEEEGTTEALALLDADVIHVPDFMLVETANVLWSKVRRQVLKRADADDAYAAICAVPFNVTPLADLVEPARSLSFALDVTVYDAIYAALAQRVGCPLATADRALGKAIGRSGSPLAVHLIG